MKKKKYLRTLVIVFVAFALIYVSSCGFYLFNQIDKDLLANLEGEYDGGDGICLTIVQESGELLDDDTSDPYFEIVDVEAANPGVEGQIIYLDEDTIIIKIDTFFFFDMPNAFCDRQRTVLRSKTDAMRSVADAERILPHSI